MWLKRKEHLYNLDHFDSIRLDYEYENNRYYVLMVSATRESREHETKIGPFTAAKAKEYFNEITAALKAGEVIWEFPESAES